MERLRQQLRRVVPKSMRPRIQQLVASARPYDLTFIGKVYGTDKASAHLGYTTIYEGFFRRRRRQRLAILEIGVGGTTPEEGGASLRMWRTYFPKARIVGVDIMAKHLEEPRITVLTGDQRDDKFLERLAAEHGPFDVIIDDGSHRADDAEVSFSALFEHLAPGGIYAVENLETAYWPGYGGGPPGSDGNVAAFAKRLVDVVNTRGHATNWSTLPAEARSIEALHIYDGLMVLEKAMQPSTKPAWPVGASMPTN